MTLRRTFHAFFVLSRQTLPRGSLQAALPPEIKSTLRLMARSMSRQSCKMTRHSQALTQHSHTLLPPPAWFALARLGTDDRQGGVGGAHGAAVAAEHLRVWTSGWGAGLGMQLRLLLSHLTRLARERIRPGSITRTITSGPLLASTCAPATCQPGQDEGAGVCVRVDRCLRLAARPARTSSETIPPSSTQRSPTKMSSANPSWLQAADGGRATCACVPAGAHPARARS